MNTRIFLLIIISVIFFSCRQFKELEVTGIRGFRLNKFTAQGLEGDILLDIRNPNPYSFLLYKSEFDVTYSGVYLGKARLGKKLRIKAREEKSYQVNISKDFNDISLTEVMKLLSGGSFRNELEVKGHLKAGKLFIRKSIPVDIHESIRLR